MEIISSHHKLFNTHIYTKINMASIQLLHSTIEVIASQEQEVLMTNNNIHHNQYIRIIRIFRLEVMVNIIKLIEVAPKLSHKIILNKHFRKEHCASVRMN